MAKRLTLTEYRQENAIWLSNKLHDITSTITTEIDADKCICLMYCNYLLVYGAIKYGEEVKCKNEYPTETEIEEHLKSKEVNNTIEHCHH